MKPTFLRNTQHLEGTYFVHFRDYRGEHKETYYFASSAMLRFEQLCAYPGITDISWTTAKGTVFESAKMGARL